jgi:predicted Holliday junction resolvase-like endonuclease
MIRFILLALVLYILYKLVFELIVPVYKTARQVRSQFRNMQQQAQEHMNDSRQNVYPGNQHQAKGESKAPAGEYIDFEEIK